MSSDPVEMQRRRFLQSAAGLAIGQIALDAVSAFANEPNQPPSKETKAVGATVGKTPGKPGDFNFLAGSWKISHRQLKKPGTDEWDLFQGEATCWTILGGVGSIEELRIPARNFSGLGLRLLDVDNKVWYDYWVNARSGVLTPPGMPGSFENGAGIFIADDVDGDTPIKVRGVWDRITPTSCRWHQAISRDGGKSWEENWFMDWTRV
ncbi:MAG: hypothetical protein U0V87_11060 [Acidobacteriota bacterium]